MKSGEREIEDGVAEAQMAAIMKAESSGDPRLLEDIALSTAIKKLHFEERAFREEQLEIDYQLSRTEKIINSAPTLIAMIEKDVGRGEKAPTGDNFKIKIADKTMTDRTEAGQALIQIHSERLNEYKTDRRRSIREDNESMIIGDYAGFPLKMRLTNVYIDTESHKIMVSGEAMPYPAVSAVTDDASAKGLISSIHATITKSLKNRLLAERDVFTNAQSLHTNLLSQKEAIGKFWSKSIELEKLKEDSIKLKKAIARDAEKAKVALKQKKCDEKNKHDMEMAA